MSLSSTRTKSWSLICQTLRETMQQSILVPSSFFEEPHWSTVHWPSWSWLGGICRTEPRCVRIMLQRQRLITYWRRVFTRCHWWAATLIINYNFLEGTFFFYFRELFIPLFTLTMKFQQLWVQICERNDVRIRLTSGCKDKLQEHLRTFYIPASDKRFPKSLRDDLLTKM